VGGGANGFAGRELLTKMQQRGKSFRELSNMTPVTQTPSNMSPVKQTPSNMSSVVQTS
jgi:hypothetical protein